MNTLDNVNRIINDLNARPQTTTQQQQLDKYTKMRDEMIAAQTGAPPAPPPTPGRAGTPGSMPNQTAVSNAGTTQPPSQPTAPPPAPPINPASQSWTPPAQDLTPSGVSPNSLAGRHEMLQQQANTPEGQQRDAMRDAAARTGVSQRNRAEADIAQANAYRGIDSQQATADLVAELDQAIEDRNNPWISDPVLNTVAQTGRVLGGVAQGATKIIGAVPLAATALYGELTGDTSALEGVKGVVSDVNATIQSATDEVIPRPNSDVAKFVSQAADALGEATPGIIATVASGGSALIGSAASYAMGGANAFSTELVEGSGDPGRALTAGIFEAGVEAASGKIIGGLTGKTSGIGARALEIGSEGVEEVVSGAAQSGTWGDSYTLADAGRDALLGSTVGAAAGGIVAPAVGAVGRAVDSATSNTGRAAETRTRDATPPETRSTEPTESFRESASRINSEQSPNFRATADTTSTGDLSTPSEAGQMIDEAPDRAFVPTADIPEANTNFQEMSENTMIAAESALAPNDVENVWYLQGNDSAQEFVGTLPETTELADPSRTIENNFDALADAAPQTQTGGNMEPPNTTPPTDNAMLDADGDIDSLLASAGINTDLSQFGRDAAAAEAEEAAAYNVDQPQAERDTVGLSAENQALADELRSAQVDTTEVEETYEPHPLDLPEVDSAGRSLRYDNDLTEEEVGLPRDNSELEPQLQPEPLPERPRENLVETMEADTVTETPAEAMERIDQEFAEEIERTGINPDRELSIVEEAEALLSSGTAEVDALLSDADAVLQESTTETEADVNSVLAEADSLIEADAVEDTAPEAAPEPVVEPPVEADTMDDVAPPDADTTTDLSTTQEVETTTEPDVQLDQAIEQEVTTPTQTNTPVETVTQPVVSTESDVNTDTDTTTGIEPAAVEVATEAEQILEETDVQSAPSPQVAQVKPQPLTNGIEAQPGNGVYEEPTYAEELVTQVGPQVNPAIQVSTATNPAASPDVQPQTETQTQVAIPQAQAVAVAEPETEPQTETQTQEQLSRSIWTPLETAVSDPGEAGRRRKLGVDGADPYLYLGQDAEGRLQGLKSYSETFRGLANNIEPTTFKSGLSSY